MRKNSASLYIKTLSFILTLLGFSCSDSTGPVEYGVPSAKFRVKGKVFSTINGEKKPLSNIKLKLSKGYDSDSTYSGIDGNFDFALQGFPDNSPIPLTISDIDGGENHGEFEEQKIDVDFSKATFINGDRHWYEGEATKELGNIELTLKEEEN